MAKTAQGGRGRAHDIDRQIGARIRQRRIILGLTQQQLAATMGISHQQVFKYEAGNHRVSAATLYDIARTLGVEIGYFFEGLQMPSAKSERDTLMTLQLARNFVAISNPNLRQALQDIARIMAASDAGNRDNE